MNNIQNITPEAPLIGRIYLGLRIQQGPGIIKRPVTTEYFVIKKLEDEYRIRIEEVYGLEPKELDIVFPDDDIGKIIPTSLVWFSGGMQDENGELAGGYKKCSGNGPNKNGEPGIALWHEKQDPITHIVPTRPCLGPNCPDWFGPNGRQQCEKRMQVICILPRITLNGVFIISTRSFYSIKSFLNNLSWAKRMNGYIKGIPFKIAREIESIPYTDPSNRRRTGTQYIMKLFPNDGFYEKCEPQILKKLQTAFIEDLALPSYDEQLQLNSPEGDIESQAMERNEKPPVILEMPKPLSAMDVIALPEIKELFNTLGSITGKKFTEKAMALAVRKLEGAEDLVLATRMTLEQKIGEAKLAIKPDMPNEQSPLAAQPANEAISQQMDSEPSLM